MLQGLKLMKVPIQIMIEQIISMALLNHVM